MKRRRHQPLLPPVGLAFGEQQPLADQRPEALHRDPFGEGALRFGQHSPHVIRVVDLPGRQMEEAEGADVAVDRGVALQEFDRVLVVTGETAVNQMVFRARESITPGRVAPHPS